MSDWKVIGSRVEIFPHPNAEKLVLGKVGPFQLVFSISNGYKDGDIVFFAPEKSILPDEIKGEYCNTQTGESYLSGSDKNRVKRVRLRNEYSDGVTLNPEWVERKLGLHRHEIPLNVDLSEQLGITKYEPPIPVNMGGVLERIEGFQFQRHHDVEAMRIYESEFVPGEEVIVTEKVHGSQISIMRTTEGRWFVTSKGVGKSGLAIQESEGNLYWQALNNSGLRLAIDTNLNKVHEKYGEPVKNEIQLFGEVIPCQKGYSYGQDKPTIRLFRVMIDNAEYSVPQMEFEALTGHDYTYLWKIIYQLWVPIVYRGPFNIKEIVELSKGKELVSGQQLHIREGVVVAPFTPRRSKEGFPLFLKQINPAYKDDEEAFS